MYKCPSCGALYEYYALRESRRGQDYIFRHKETVCTITADGNHNVRRV